MNRIGERIKDLRKKEGISLKWLDYRAGTNSSFRRKFLVKVNFYGIAVLNNTWHFGVYVYNINYIQVYSMN